MDSSVHSSDSALIRHEHIKNIIREMFYTNDIHGGIYVPTRRSVIINNISVYHPAIYYILPNYTVLDVIFFREAVNEMDDNIINDITTIIIEVILRYTFSDLTLGGTGIRNVSYTSILDTIRDLLLYRYGYSFATNGYLKHPDIVVANTTDYFSRLSLLLIEQITNGHDLISIDTIFGNIDSRTGNYLYHYLTEYYYVMDYDITTVRNKLMCNVIVETYNVKEANNGFQHYRQFKYREDSY